MATSRTGARTTSRALALPVLARPVLLATALFVLASCAASTERQDAGDASSDGAVLDSSDATVDGGAPRSCGDVLTAPGVTCEVLGGVLIAPRDVWVTRAGDVVVTEMGAGRVVRLVGDRFETIASGLMSPIGIREASDGALLVADENTHSVERIDPATGARTTIASGLPSVTYLELDASGRIYVSSFEAGGSGAVLRIDPASLDVTPYATGLSVPEGLFVDADGSLVVAEWQLPSAVLRFPPGGGDVAAAELVADAFERIYGLIPDGDGGVFVSDHAGRIVRVRGDGTREIVLDRIGRPGGLARDPSGALYVAEFVDFGAEGRLLRLGGLAP